MRRIGLVAACLLVACGEPETEIVEVRIPVALLDPDEDHNPCPDAAFTPTRSVAVEIHQPLADIGRCVLDRECVEIDGDAPGSLAELQEVLRGHGVYFEPLPEYEGVQLHVRGLADPGCVLDPPEIPLFCGFSTPVDIGEEIASFNVVVRCTVDRSACPPPPPCAGVDFE